jgi:hypothetical protein
MLTLKFCYRSGSRIGGAVFRCVRASPKAHHADIGLSLARLRRMIDKRGLIGVWTAACLVVPAGQAYSR